MFNKNLCHNEQVRAAPKQFLTFYGYNHTAGMFMLTPTIPTTVPTTDPTTVPTSMTSTYRSFLIRLWQSHADGAWRASAQSIQSGETMHFVDLDSLFVFLQAQGTDYQTSAQQFYGIGDDSQ